MIHAYNDTCLDSVMHNLAAMFDLAINAEEINPEEFSEIFVSSSIAKRIELGEPRMLVGTSSIELLSILLDKDLSYDTIPMNRTKEYWAGWILAKAQWQLDIPFKKILDSITLTKLISLYNPYHEAPEEKTIEYIKSLLPESKSKLKKLRKQKGFSQEQLAFASGVNIRSIRAYEQDPSKLLKASGETLLMLSNALECNIEELIKPA